MLSLPHTNKPKAMKTFYFNTGVKIWNNPHIPGGIDSGNGTVVIPFDCADVPEGAKQLYCCDSPNITLHSHIPADCDVIVREIHNSKMISKYAYFTVKKDLVVTN